MYSIDKPAIKYRKDYQPSQYLIHKTYLDFKLFDDHVLVDAKLEIKRNPLDQNVSLMPLVLDGVELELIDIRIDDNPLTEQQYEIQKEYLTVIEVSEKFSLSTRVKIYPNKNTSLEGLYLSNGKFCTQCEAEGFRKITYYLDRPEIMSEFFVTIEADKRSYPLLLSNGNPIEQSQDRNPLSSENHIAIWHDPFPKPSYLFALVAGDLDCLEESFTTMSQRTVKLQLFVDKGKLDQCQFAMKSLIESMKWDEQKFGREYDLDLYMIVAVSDFNMGAMENKGLNVFNTAYVLANEKTATDADFEGVERVIAHEYFHNWTGNRITCRDWFQLSLKEGLTVFRDQKFSEDMQSAAVERIDQVKIIRAAQFAEDSGPLAHPIRPDSYIEMNNFYTVTVYNKGAEVIRMMHTLLGEQGFRSGMDLYFDRHDGQAVTCEDFVKSMEDANHVDWSQFRNWYRQAGTPSLKVKKLTSEEKNQVTSITFEFSQSCPNTPGQSEKKAFMIPLKVAFVNPNGQPARIKLSSDKKWHDELLINITEFSQSFTLETDSRDAIPSLLRGFTAPVKLEYNYSSEDLACLFAHDSDSFNRWDAGQTLMNRFLLSDKNTHLDGLLETICGAIKKLLDDKELDSSLTSLAVQLPNLNGLIGESESIDLDRLFKNYQKLRISIATRLESYWLAIYTRLSHASDSNNNSSARRLKNTALAYLMLAKEDEHYSKAELQQRSAVNMSDELAALQVICNSECENKAQPIDRFYQKWQNEELVLDKWFSAQVMHNSDSIYQALEKLLQHDKFSITNPNKVRAVIGAFVGNNTQQFHNSTGEGYELLAKLIIKLNGINPSIGARLAKQFGQWKKFDSKRQAIIRELLERILTIKDISNDIYEVVEKSLHS